MDRAKHKTAIRSAISQRSQSQGTMMSERNANNVCANLYVAKRAIMDLIGLKMKE